MPAAARVGNLIYVMTPMVNVQFRDAYRCLTMACRSALETGRQPISPVVMYGGFLPEDELVSSLPVLTRWWIKRCSQIWLVTLSTPSDTYISLDPLSYNILLDNEYLCGHLQRQARDYNRLPVYRLNFPCDEALPQLMSRSELATLLRCNIVEGLFHGGLE